MSSMNKVILVGYLGADPEVRSFQNGGQVCNFRLATNETWKDKETGERRQRTEWHNIAIFNEALVRIAEQYLRKGSRVGVEGQLATRKWQDQNGQDRYTTEVVLRPYKGELTLLDSAQGRSDDARDPGHGAGTANGHANGHQKIGHDYGAPAAGGGYGSTRSGGGIGAMIGDDIPFEKPYR